MTDNQQTERFAAEFLIESLPYTDESGETKRQDHIMLKVTFSKNHIVCRKMEEADKKQFERAWAKFVASKEYKAFQDGEVEEDVYTPLTTLTGIGPTIMGQLDEAGIKSIEQLATAEDEQISHIRGFEKLRNRAIERLTDPVNP